LGNREIDYSWEKLGASRTGLTDGGEPNVCGWLRDKFGLRWQIVPSQIWDWLNGDDPAIVQRVTSKVWPMGKLDMAELQRAAAAKG
jgi:predicted 3-demethylubiquinone-9 3-methyltransferase (glyoxalase superfamily)